MTFLPKKPLKGGVHLLDSIDLNINKYEEDNSLEYTVPFAIDIRLDWM